MSESRAVVVFAGVGCLGLDPDAHRAGGDALGLLSARGVPLVLCSGRTRAELEYLQHRIGMAHPFICEHGAAVFVRTERFPGQSFDAVRSSGPYAVLEFGRRYVDVVAGVRRAALKARASIVTFSEMSIAEVASACGVTLLRARLAKLREYGEAFRVLDDGDGVARRRLWRQLHSAQLACVADGAFDFAGPPIHLGIGAQWLMGLYRRTLGPIVTIGIGDRFHHGPLLRAVDVPIVVSRDAATVRQLIAAVPRAIELADGDLATLLAAVLDRQSWFATL